MQIRVLVLSREPVATGADFFASMDAIQKFIIPQIQPQIAVNIQQILDEARRVTA